MLLFSSSLWCICRGSFQCIKHCIAFPVLSDRYFLEHYGSSSVTIQLLHRSMQPDCILVDICAWLCNLWQYSTPQAFASVVCHRAYYQCSGCPQNLQERKQLCKGDLIWKKNMQLKLQTLLSATRTSKKLLSKKSAAFQPPEGWSFCCSKRHFILCTRGWNPRNHWKKRMW